MTTLDLDDDQASLLRELLDGAYRDLKYEISNTGMSDFKTQLRGRETTLRALLDRVGGPLPDPR